MRLGKKKDKDKEAEIRSVDGITRLICLSKSQAPLKGKNLQDFIHTMRLNTLWNRHIWTTVNLSYEREFLEFE